VLDDRIQGGQAPDVGRDDEDRSLCAWPDVDVRRWGRPRVPFPVTAPYRPRPDLVRLGSVAHGRLECTVLDADDSAPDVLRDKQARLRAAPERCVALDGRLAADPDAVWSRVRAAAVAVVAAQARAVREPGAADDASRPVAPVALVDGEIRASLAGWAFPADPGAPFALRALRADARPVLDWIASRPPAERPLHALGLALQEDFAWMEAAPGEPARARLLHVCFPSGWDPARKIGLDFAAIHAPVAEAELLRSSALALSRALTTQGPFVRFVWTVAPDGRRARHPAEATPWTASCDPWFRCERQVSLPVRMVGADGGAGAVFLIRLHGAPLLAAADTPARCAALRDALASMSSETLAYKGLTAALPRLLRLLERRPASAPREEDRG
jgi:hypothetical protein